MTVLELSAYLCVGSIDLPDPERIDGHVIAGFLRSWKTWKSHGISIWLFPGLEKSLKNHKGFGKVMEMCYIHMFSHTVFEQINMFLKERSLNYKQAIFLFFSPCE